MAYGKKNVMSVFLMLMCVQLVNAQDNDVSNSVGSPDFDIIPVYDSLKGTVEFDDSLQAFVYRTTAETTEQIIDDFCVVAEDSDGNSNSMEFTVQIDGTDTLVTTVSDVLSEAAALLPSGIVSFVQEKEEEKKEYEMIIYVDQPGKKGDRNPVQPGGVGHVSICVIDHVNNKETWDGFWPGGLLPGSPGKHNDDEDYMTDPKDGVCDVKKGYPISKEQYEKIIKMINDTKTKKIPFSMTDQTIDPTDGMNCTTWVLHLCEEGGVIIKTTPDPVDADNDGKPDDLDGDGKPDYVLHAPQGLDEDLANSGGTRK